MCKIKVSVSYSCEQEKSRAAGKLKDLPNVTSLSHESGRVIAIVEHPLDITDLQAAAWAKDKFGMDPALVPSATILA